MKKVLIADDMPISQMITDNMLAGRYQTFCASSAEEAIDICRKKQPDLILSDFSLSGLRGAKLLEKFREEAGEDVPIIFMTADTSDEAETDSLDSGAVDFIHKPFSAEVLLRRVAKALENAQQTSKPQETSAKRKILIVDDMIVSLMITENMLADQYQTFCAQSAKEAMEIYRAEKPDMILSDFRMPGMTGYEMQIALQNEFHKKIPFMFMTADKSDEVESEGFDNGAMDFIRKPFQPEVLLRRVANIVNTVGEIQDLKKTSTIDKLTGLFNKGSSEEELKKVCKKSHGALMMIDLDSFKLVNDIHGHAMGDKILIAFADILRATMRSTDLIGRMGGDEFVAFCHGIHEESAIASKTQFINEKITEAAKQLMGEDMNIPLGASIGCVLIPQAGTDFTELYKKADKALYIVKKNGKHGYNIFSEDAPEDKVETVVTLAQVQMILGERNIEAGAMVLPFESFRTIYRFIKRTRAGYGKTICIVLLVLKRTAADDGTVPLKHAGDQLIECLHSTLRRGDVVSQNGRNQFLVLLTNTDGHYDVTRAISRVVENWGKLPESKSFYFTQEWAVLDA